MDKVKCIAPLVDGGLPWRRVATGDTLLYTDWHKDNFWRGVQAELGATRGRIGVEMDHISADNLEKLKTAVQGAKPVDVGVPCMQMRMVKSKEEIALTKEGARIAQIGGAVFMDACDVGVSEYEVALRSTQAMVGEIAKAFPNVELMNTWSWCQTGATNTDCAHNANTSRKIKSGDIIVLNCFPMIAGYFSALERTLFMDHIPSDRHLELWDINCTVHRRGLELVRPGVRCCDVATELNELYRPHNLLQYRSFGYGHSFGVISTFYGREAGLELREDVETVLKPGMILSMEPMITIPIGTAGAGGYREHDLLVVTEDGNENLTRTFPLGSEQCVINRNKASI
ncbi:hypothetical protein BSL78_11015 [Apostichopus japonicus]|uniref:Creatinase n=1 Tax=Stichopus japonicus TaxID=307972 RepID=A0A2G8KVM9_STIJA|nr:hypothetical protein BSL78_11015 [Apostichopus japonicus]